MTYIEDTWSYDGLPQIHILTSDFKLKSLGYYDPDRNRDTEFSYQSGKFTKPDGSPYDIIYQGKQGMMVSFKDLVFGHHRWARNLAGHSHIKYIVSTSLIRPHEVLVADPETKDLIIFADLARNPPMVIGDKPQETLYEITPHLTPEQLARLPKEIKFATKMQEKMYQLEEDKFKLAANLILTESTAIGAMASTILYQEELASAMKNHQINQKKYARLQLLTGDKITETIEKVEKGHFLNAPWDSKNHEEATNMLESTQAELRNMAATVKLMGSPTDAQKYQVLMMAVNIVGLDFAVKHIPRLEQYNINTPTGIEKFTISKEPGLQELLLHYGKLYENKQISFEDWQKAVTDAVRQDQERRKKSDAPNAAVQDSRRELIKQVVPEMQVR